MVESSSTNVEDQAHVYVAEIFIPAPVYMPERTHLQLGKPEYYGCKRGYWQIHFETDDQGTPRPLGFSLTVELTANDRVAAEDAALTTGLRFAQVSSTYSGSPLVTPRLLRIAQVGDKGGVIEQHDYYYLEGPEALPRAMLRTHELEKLLLWFGDLAEGIRDRIELSARWYGMSVAAQDPLDGYLSAWIGLESGGPPLSAAVHLSGLKARCGICRNEPGGVRKKGDAGIIHAIKAVAPELLSSRTLQDLRDLRNKIAHGYEPGYSVRPEAQEILPDLQLSLLFTILTAVRPDTTASRSGKALLPRDFKIYPDARHSSRSTVELTHHQPFYGKWIEIEREFPVVKTRLEANGNYVWGASTRVKQNATVPMGATAPKREYVIFERMGRNWENLWENIDDPDSELNEIPVIPWRTIKMTAAWSHYMSKPE